MNQKRPTSNLIVIGPAQWIYLAIFLLILAPFTVATLCADKLYAGYVKTYIAPALEQRLGFKLQRRQMHYYNQPLNVFVITDLQPNGVLARAGVQNGDVPVRMFAMSDVTFYQLLHYTRKYPVEIGLVNSREYEEMVNSRDLVLADRVRRVLIPRVAPPHLYSHHLLPLTPTQCGQVISFIFAWVLTIVAWRRLNQ